MIWDQDGQINNANDLHKAVVRWATLRDQPVKFTLGQMENKP
jgi:hypothetical protein